MLEATLVITIILQQLILSIKMIEEKLDYIAKSGNEAFYIFQL